ATGPCPESRCRPAGSPLRSLAGAHHDWPASGHAGTGRVREITHTASGTGEDCPCRLDHPLRHGSEAGSETSADLAGERPVALCA
ncbi:hypothetical protein, partial [Salmonella enterica]|uniref:hypothetical protein n=1 Tax=Salmonella enterica TaxID=28901 RepID=UPI001C62F3A1